MLDVKGDDADFVCITGKVQDSSMQEGARTSLTRLLDYQVWGPFLRQGVSAFYLRQSDQLSNSKRRSEHEEI